MSYKSVFVVLYILMLPFVALQAQTRKQLEQQKENTLKDLALTKKMLGETAHNKRGTLNKINLLNRSIKQSNQYVRLLNDEISMLNSNLKSLNKELGHLDSVYIYVKKEYADMCWASYKYNHYFSPIVFILSSENVNQAFRRYRYLKEFQDYRSQQMNDLEAVTASLEKQKEAIALNRQKKAEAVQQKAYESTRLKTQKSKQSKMYKELSRKEKSLKRKQRQQQKKADQLNKQIQKLIAEEIKKNAAKHPELTKEEKLVSGNFAKNKGKLPKPVGNSYISSHFGMHAHPTLKHVKVNNKGSYYQAPKGSVATCIYDGVVTQCFAIPGGNNAVIVQHGTYRSVYSNLTTLYVKKGDKVKIHQKIGKIFVDTEDDNKTELYFMLYRDTKIQNPELWIRK